MTSGGAKLVIGVVLDLDLQSSVFNGDAVFEAVGDSIVDGVARMAVGHHGKGVLSARLTSCSETRCGGRGPTERPRRTATTPPPRLSRPKTRHSVQPSDDFSSRNATRDDEADPHGVKPEPPGGHHSARREHDARRHRGVGGHMENAPSGFRSCLRSFLRAEPCRSRSTMPGAAEICLCRCATSSTGGSVRLRLGQVLRLVEILQPHHRRDDGAFGLGTTWRELWPKLGDDGLRKAAYRGG
ncbi:hypothetical protein ABIE65_005096 [Constrictibacter sp. MBR-5]